MAKEGGCLSLRGMDVIGHLLLCAEDCCLPADAVLEGDGACLLGSVSTAPSGLVSAAFSWLRQAVPRKSAIM